MDFKSLKSKKPAIIGVTLVVIVLGFSKCFSGENTKIKSLAEAIKLCVPYKTGEKSSKASTTKNISYCQEALKMVQNNTDISNDERNRLNARFRLYLADSYIISFRQTHSQIEKQEASKILHDLVLDLTNQKNKIDLEIIMADNYSSDDWRREILGQVLFELACSCMVGNETKAYLQKAAEFGNQKAQEKLIDFNPSMCQTPKN
ncbi:hypothetical protein HHE02_16500 [Helicobacter heilmannii]|uniref:hypothetical protein n=1 Tax=Helicobacter heilmannii TaxID=35817 RepID=UPI0006A00AE7|nr:hypothetical protein [Helicobacter heilmannii]CRF48325.1 hypothetical protein HHE02_16500 [Helicobacter heilmannii]